MNAPYPVTYSAVQFAVRCVTDPWNPANSGCYRPVSVVAPLGSVVNPRLPASVIAGNVETASTIVDAVMGALAEAVPHRVIAAGSGTAGNVVLGGKDPRPGRDGREFVYLESCGGCWGARPDDDGINAMRYSIGNTGNGPIEVVETEYPVEILSYGLAQDAGGAGKRRGGLPVRRVFRLASDAVFTLAAEKSRFQPSGLFGGRPGALARYVLITGKKEERLFSKTRPVPLRAGDILDIQPPGAGGYGDPLERDPERVAWDVAEGYVSGEQAREAYGVVFDAAGAVDREATLQLRKARARG
jgi:N-methylhydantoinase B